MEVIYDRAAIQEYMDDMGNVGTSLRRMQDRSVNQYNSCRMHYTRLHAEAEQAVKRAENRVREAEANLLYAQQEYAAAQAAIHESGKC